MNFLYTLSIACSVVKCLSAADVPSVALLANSATGANTNRVLIVIALISVASNILIAYLFG